MELIEGTGGIGVLVHESFTREGVDGIGLPHYFARDYITLHVFDLRVNSAEAVTLANWRSSRTQSYRHPLALSSRRF